MIISSEMDVHIFLTLNEKQLLSTIVSYILESIIKNNYFPSTTKPLR